jgi:hypothetical protein
MQDGRRYDGEWENDMRSGFGIFRWPINYAKNGGVSLIHHHACACVCGRAVVRVRCVRSGRASAVLIEESTQAICMRATGRRTSDTGRGSTYGPTGPSTRGSGRRASGKASAASSGPTGAGLPPPSSLRHIVDLALTFLACHRYEGEYKDGKMSGKGTFCWPDGSVYVGEYKVHFLLLLLF